MAKTRRRRFPTKTLLPTIVAALKTRPSSAREISLFAQLNGFPSAGAARLGSICSRIATNNGLRTSIGSLGEIAYQFLEGFTDIPLSASLPVAEEDQAREDQINRRRQDALRAAREAKTAAHAGIATTEPETVSTLTSQISALADQVQRLETLVDRLAENASRKPTGLHVNGRLPFSTF